MLWVRRLVVATVVLVVLAAGAGLVFVRRAGMWNLVFPSEAHETQPPELPDDLGAIYSPSVLVFTKTNAFRHIDGIAAGVERLEEIAARRKWSLFHTENGAVFNRTQLGRFDAVVFLNTTGDVLDEAQEAAFEHWLQDGGGWVGVHAAGDGSHDDWPWYVDTLIGAHFTAHPMRPQFQLARVVVEDGTHPATRRLPAEFMHRDEWYSWEASPRERAFHVLARLDESTYSPTIDFMGEHRDLRMGDHPVVWTRCVGRGRSLYSALGHTAESYSEPENAALLEGAVAWAARAEGEGCD